MTLGTTHSFVSYDGNGLDKTFGVDFEFHAASDLEVILVTAATGAESVQTQGFHYHVSGGDGEQGQIHFIEPTPAPASGQRVLIRRLSPDIQPDDLVDGGALAAEPLERRLDIIAARLQELETDIARSLKVAKGSQATALDLNLVGGKNRQLTVASDEQGVIIATGTLPDSVQTSPFGEDWINLSGPGAGRAELSLGTAALQSIGTSGANVPLLNGNNSYSGTSVFAGDASFNSDVIIGAPFVLGSETLSIDGNGAIAPTKSHVLLSNAASLSAIAVTNHPVGAILELRPGTSGQWPTLRHQAPGSGNIFLSGGVSAALDATDKTIWLQHRNDAGQSSGWYEIGRSFAQPTGYIHVRHTEPQGTSGGVPTTGAWTIGKLNDEKANTSPGASLTSNVLNLPAGNYSLQGYRCLYRTEHSRLRLLNATSGTTLLISQSARASAAQAPAATASSVPVLISGRFVLSSASSVEFQYYVETAHAGVRGLGSATNIADELEVYAELILRGVV